MSDQSFQRQNARKFPADYRKEVAPRIMEWIAKGESCFLVGVSGTGKSNLFRFIKSVEAREKYLGEQADDFAFVWADTNALAGELSAFHLYELMLYNCQKWAEENEKPGISASLFQELHEKVVLSENRILAQRHLETALRYLFNRIENLHIVLLFDEFEPIAKTLDFQFFKNLRWLRDEFKYRLSYMMAAHRTPIAIREELFDQGEPFYELLAPNILGLPLYNSEDTEFTISELSNRYGVELTTPRKEIIFRHSGGHAGLITAIFKVLFKHALAHDETWQIEQLLAYDSVAGECRKIWNTLETGEQELLLQFIKGDLEANPSLAINSLTAKGIISKDASNQITLFSPLFDAFLKMTFGEDEEVEAA